MGTEPKAWESVLARIEERLVDGRLRPGDHLPPERTLAAELGVARSSVREAVRVLEAMGLIRTQTGSGPSSGAIIIARPIGGMQALQPTRAGFLFNRSAAKAYPFTVEPDRRAASVANPHQGRQCVC